MQLICPHCRTTIQLESLPPDDIICTCCGSSFRLGDESTTGWRPGIQKKIDRFEVLDILGQGAFGTVYRARDPELDRDVAIKVPRTGSLTDSRDRERFLREARSAAQLRHAGIVPIHEVGQADGAPYLVTQFIQGVTLADWLTAHSVTPQQAAVLTVALAEALHYAHEHRIVHRDVKPANIMMDEAGMPHLMDFGLAKRDGGDITVTLEGQVLGTPAYMSPEQAGGEAHSVDGRSDVYSLGVVLYRLLAGDLPFRGNKRMLLHQVLHEEPRSPRALNDQVPRDLETICLKAMAKIPGQRYATAAALAVDLHHFLKGEPIKARPIRAWERAWRWARRRPAVAGLLAALVCILAASLAGLTALWLHAEDRRQQAETAQGEEEKAKVIAQNNLEEARLNLYVSNVQLAHRAWQEGNVSLVRELLDGPTLTPLGDFRRDFEWDYLNHLCHTELLEIEEPLGFGGAGVSYSPDGRWFATSDEKGVIRIRAAATEAVWQTLYGHKASLRTFAFSPNSKLLVSSDNKYEVLIWDVLTGKPVPFDRPANPNLGITQFDAVTRKEIPVKHNLATGLAFSPDGRHLAFAEAASVQIVDWAEGKEVACFQGGCSRIWDVAYRPDGARVAAVGPGLRVWDLPSKKLLFTTPGELGFRDSLVYSPDGQRLAWGLGRAPEIRVHDANNGSLIATLSGHFDRVTRVAFSRDGRHLVSSSADKTIIVWDTATWKQEYSIKGHTGVVVGVAFSPDGRRLVSAGEDHRAKIWQFPGTQEKRVYTAKTYLNNVSALRPDGRSYAVANASGNNSNWTITIRDAMTGLETAKCQGHSYVVTSMMFSPDGRFLASANASPTGRGPVQVFLWSALNGQPIRLVDDKHEASQVLFSRDSQQLLTKDRHGTVRTWNVSTGSLVSTLSLPFANYAAIAVSPDGGRLACQSGAESIVILDTANASQLVTIPYAHQANAGNAMQMVFSPDGRRLASSLDTLIQVADATRGEVLLRLKGHNDNVGILAFSPDGSRLASASGGTNIVGEVKLWETKSGQELLTFKTVPGVPKSLIFTNEGRRLALLVSKDDLSQVLYWDAARPSPEEVAERDANVLVPGLFEKLLLREDVLASLREDTQSGVSLRRAALLLAEHFPEDAAKLNNASWAIVSAPGASSEATRQALRLAKEACQLQPQDGILLNTLGAAHYRLREYQAACDTLLRSERLNLARFKFVLPADIAFLALARHKLGRSAEAQADLARLREALTEPRWAKNKEAKDLLQEAEKVLQIPRR